MVANSVAREVYVAAPVERVWATLTQVEHFVVWYAFGGAEIDLRPGGRLLLKWEEHGEYRGVVEAVEPPTRFAYRYAVDPDVEPAPGNSNLVEFTLVPEGDGTRLRVVESGFDRLVGTEVERARRIGESEQAWGSALHTLAARAPGVATRT